MPEGLAWLSPDERVRLASFRFAKRRQEWLLGRWTAKQTLLTYSGYLPGNRATTEVAVRSASSGEPRIFVEGEELSVSVSLSHRAGAALCSMVESGRVGCDLEWVEDRSPAFVEDYFGPAERRLIRAGDSRYGAVMANVLWSAKESALKVLGLGLRLDARRLEVQPGGPCTERWEPFRIHDETGNRVFDGWWRWLETWVLTVVAVPSTPAPRLIAHRRGEG